jgi:hypothetical protein
MQTIQQEDRGTLTLRLLQTGAGYSGVIVNKSGGRVALIDGTDRNDVWRRLEDEAAKTRKGYIGFDGARARFLRFFPQGFETPLYAQYEREYKDKARDKLERFAPLEQALRAEGLGKVILEVYRGTNLIEQRFELRRVQDLLRSPSADGFIRAAAKLANGAGATALAEMAQLAKPYECAKWTVVTYLPFMWRPETHMFLKPEVTKEFAERVGHQMIHAYKPTLDMSVYDSLQDLALRTEYEIADLHPHDRIDVQSFIWVVGKYKDADLQAAKAST